MVGLAVGGIVVGWFVLLGVLAAATEPRRVGAGPETLDLGGPESPAVVNLVASDWRLGQESLPATLLDLAARKLVAIEQVGDSTYVRVRSAASVSGATTGYEDMVLDHVRRLAEQTPDNMVPAEALTTGPQDDSAGWWRQYRRAVESEARDRGLSRARWSPGVRTLLTVSAVAVGVAVSVGVFSLVGILDEWSEEQAAAAAPDPCPPATATTTTTPTATTTAATPTPTTACSSTGTAGTSTADTEEGDNPIVAVIMVGVVSWGGLVSLVEGVGRRQRDTPAGREAAAKWLGLREMLAENPLFASQPPAGVAIWDRHIAYGAALGVAHGAVRALPLGAESDTTAWSSATGRWRVVRIRYPRRVPPAYGRHPLRAASVGLLQLTAALTVLRVVPRYLYNDLIVDVRDLEADFATDGVELAAHVTAIVIATAAALVGARAAWMFGLGFLDLASGRRTVEGKVLRFRLRGTDKNPAWYMAVDDGTTDRIRAWRFHSVQQENQGTSVTAEVTKRLQHVRWSTDRVPSRTDTPVMNAPGD